ncbi:MAG TPA: hypothetical protein VMV41_17205 [Cellulomonadaceae bacterium]|nr:hypothetical protein [Cellulomonadaceae bacterium]
MLLSALGACTSMTMRLYAARKGWEFGTTSVTHTGGSAVVGRSGRYRRLHAEMTSAANWASARRERRWSAPSRATKDFGWCAAS